ncbi:MAG TPA: CRISPR system precrRNA processing endoribonuclease RAMP protein Cas6 [Geomonas sp.]|nr:CRISPR system precrRNA processing endoribonuclease RAMP protein Cas6 [Geomonas sp.]
MELHFVKLIFTVTFNSGLTDAYALFGCRAHFEAAFRKAVNCRRGDCAGCRLGAGCPYPANFGQALAQDPDAIRRHQKPPLPFVFRFPVIPSAPSHGVTAECALTLFGCAVQDACHFIVATRFLMAGMGGAVTAVEADCPGGGRTPVADAAQPALPLLSGLDPTGTGPLSPDRLTISFLTPLKLMNEGRLLKEVTFPNIARALMRRVSSLAYYYDGAEPQLDYRWLSQRSDSVSTVSSGCRFVSWNGRPAGITGTLCFHGDLEPFHLLLQLGVATQLGKGASFGFGAYRIESASSSPP